MSLGFLLDTNIPSEFSKPLPHASLRAWIEVHTNLYLSVISVGELQMGTALLPLGKRRAQLETWLTNYLLPWRTERILPVTEAIARSWGDLAALRQKDGRPLPTSDGLIAATALVHGLILVTRNEKDFKGLGLNVVTP